MGTFFGLVRWMELKREFSSSGRVGGREELGYKILLRISVGNLFSYTSSRQGKELQYDIFVVAGTVLGTLLALTVAGEN